MLRLPANTNVVTESAAVRAARAVFLIKRKSARPAARPTSKYAGRQSRDVKEPHQAPRPRHQHTRNRPLTVVDLRAGAGRRKTWRVQQFPRRVVLLPDCRGRANGIGLVVGMASREGSLGQAIFKCVRKYRVSSGSNIFRISRLRCLECRTSNAVQFCNCRHEGK